MDHADVERTVADCWGALADLLAGVARDDWRGASGLAGWTLGDLAAHAVWGSSMEAEALRRATAGTTEAAAGQEVDATDPDATVAALRRARGELLAAVAGSADLPDDAPVPLAAGTFPMALVRPVLAMEAGIHLDDARLAIGIDRDLDPVVAHAALAFFSAFVPVLGGLGTAPPPVGTVMEVLGDTVALVLVVGPAGWAPVVEAPAPPTARVVADDTSVVRLLYGRHDPRAGRREVTGDGDLVARLKEWLPGP